MKFSELVRVLEEIGFRLIKEKGSRKVMIDLSYSLVIEATEDPNFFSFYSTELEGFSGVGHSVEDCLYKARAGMSEHIAVLKERQLSVPPSNPDPKIIIQNQGRLETA